MSKRLGLVLIKFERRLFLFALHTEIIPNPPLYLSFKTLAMQQAQRWNNPSNASASEMQIMFEKASQNVINLLRKALQKRFSLDRAVRMKCNMMTSQQASA